MDTTSATPNASETASAPSGAGTAELPAVRAELGEAGFVTQISIRPRTEGGGDTPWSHAIVADEPGDYGGTDTGPTPVELLGSALGSCKAITARMYAERKGWPLTGVRADVNHSRVKPASGDGPPEDRYTVELTFEGDLTDEQHARLLDIAERCPVQKMLQNQTRVESGLANA